GGVPRSRRPGRPRLPAAPPAVRALRWSAAARRDRARARLAPVRDLRRRADGEPRLEDERRDPRAPAAFRSRPGTDDGDGHARRARGADRRPHPLPRVQADRQADGRWERAGDRRLHGGDRRRVTRFALKGILGRKLRTALTALASVLGVAMVSGTFVLTDSIDDAFNTIFTDVYRGTDATITGKTAFDLNDNGSVAPPFDESLLAKVKALPDAARVVGGVGGDAQLIGKDGKAITFGGAPN